MTGTEPGAAAPGVPGQRVTDAATEGSDSMPVTTVPVVEISRNR